MGREVHTQWQINKKKEDFVWLSNHNNYMCVLSATSILIQIFFVFIT